MIDNFSATSLRLRKSSVLLSPLVFLAASLTFISLGSTADQGPLQGSKWQLELDSNYTCTGTTEVSYTHTDTHKGAVSFVMPEVSGVVDAKGGEYSYHTIGQTMGNPWEFSATGSLTFKGKVTPGVLRLTPQEYLADGTAFFNPEETFDMPIVDGATYIAPATSVPEVKCEGFALWTLRGKSKEKYKISIDDRLLWAKDHGVFSGHTY